MAVIEAIQTQYLEADVASVTFSGIPGTYEHLQVRLSARSNYADELDWWNVQLNGNSGAPYYYSWFRMTGKATTVSANVTASTSAIAWGGGLSGADNAGSQYATGIIDILDYANTNKNTTLLWTGGLTSLTAGDHRSQLGGGLWAQTDANTSILLDPSGGATLTRGSSFTLYGWKSS